eukprot:CAMPEP_0180806684 /NCGR_PEP_ID=MMETSP1038_2-20121128/62734_1 /TAXON_ID=632150 /ORGANISM="Azadinium spinosum, Strain 3D9" /LENGTH=191 /DNA_ID=CAMNT_0022847427 /DNA_START=75 /DNA_END=649 /DNA_ORIENTATION=-
MAKGFLDGVEADTIYIVYFQSDSGLDAIPDGKDMSFMPGDSVPFFLEQKGVTQQEWDALLEDLRKSRVSCLASAEAQRDGCAYRWEKGCLFFFDDGPDKNRATCCDAECKAGCCTCPVHCGSFCFAVPRKVKYVLIGEYTGDDEQGAGATKIGADGEDEFGRNHGEDDQAPVVLQAVVVEPPPQQAMSQAE